MKFGIESDLIYMIRLQNYLTDLDEIWYRIDRIYVFRLPNHVTDLDEIWYRIWSYFHVSFPKPRNGFR
jgi:hypothetical protein